VTVHYSAKWISKLDASSKTWGWEMGSTAQGIQSSKPWGKVEVNVLHIECAAFAVENAIFHRCSKECVHLSGTDFMGDWADVSEFASM